MQCPNCHANLSCGCQKRRASNGTMVCSMCIGSYEAKLRASKIMPKPRSEGTTTSTIQK